MDFFVKLKVAKGASSKLGTGGLSKKAKLGTGLIQTTSKPASNAK